VDEDGDLYTVTAGQTFDDWDDLALLETVDKARSRKLDRPVPTKRGLLPEYEEQTLIDAKILGAPVADGGLINQSQLTRIMMGAFRQMNERLTAAGI
jgi:hypothetical protein